MIRQQERAMTQGRGADVVTARDRTSPSRLYSISVWPNRAVKHPERLDIRVKSSETVLLDDALKMLKAQQIVASYSSEISWLDGGVDAAIAIWLLAFALDPVELVHLRDQLFAFGWGRG